MTELAENSWGKTDVRVSKIIRGEGSDEFVDVAVDVQLTGMVSRAYVAGDNEGVVPTDTMRNSVYVLAEEHLTHDLEKFGLALARHFVAMESVSGARVEMRGQRWRRHTDFGFVGGSSERRVAVVEATGEDVATTAGIDGLMVLKTTKSSFRGFPQDELTTLPEKDDRVLATTVGARWPYRRLPADTTSTWERVREVLLERFFADWSASVQHQGWLMAQAVLEAVPAIDEITFRLPNQHHLDFDLSRFGVDDEGVVFCPVDEPYGDIRFTVRR